MRVYSMWGLLAAAWLVPAASAHADDWRRDEPNAPPPPPRRVELSLGVEVRQLGTDGVTSKPGRVQRIAPQPDEVGDDVIAVYMQSTGELAEHVYLGLRGSVGQIDRDGDSVYYDLGGVFAVVLERGAFAARVELIGGMRGVSTYTSTAACAQRCWVTESEPMLEPRVGGDVRWVHGWSIGAHIGSDLLRRNDRLFGVYLSHRGLATDWW